MKSRFLYALSAVTLAFILLLTGCLPIPGKNTGAGTSPSPSSYIAVSASGSTFAPGGGSNTAGESTTAPSAPPSSDASPSPSSSNPSPSSSTAPSGTPLPTSPVNCLWTINVDQTIPKTVKGLTVNYVLKLVAQKSGGKTVNGSYKGVAYLAVQFDASQMNVPGPGGGLQALGGFDVNVAAYNMSFDIVKYDADTYSSFDTLAPLTATEEPLAPLTSHQAMALVSPSMTGTGSFNVQVSAPNASGGSSNSSSSTTTVMMKMTIDDGKVIVEIPSIALPDSFKGILTGVPLSTVSDKDTQAVAQASNQIKNSMDKAAAAATAGGKK